jgi:predicted HicB family RNase H-like nuclease
MTTAKRGRPRSEFPGRYQVRHSPEQMLAWLAAAQRDGRTLQNWIRRTLDKAAKK